jgi:hypothetical protein
MWTLPLSGGVKVTVRMTAAMQEATVSSTPVAVALATEPSVSMVNSAWRCPRDRGRGATVSRSSA